ncbi:T9SS type A sorting domain-containing protein [candidate division KSB1 bacterium]|nr:T9SS type A sorting domain-containing protein [candidate division KSB1 bacterium]
MNKFVTLIFFILLLYISLVFGQIETTVYWDSPRGQSTEKLLGMNIRNGLDLAVAEDKYYQDGIFYISPQLIRLHAGEISRDSKHYGQGWINTEEKKWDAMKIEKVLVSFDPGFLEKMLINIDRWPSWMDADKDDKLDENRYDDYATWCADLVRIVNMEQDWNIPYWTPFNECEDNVLNGASELALIYNKCAAAMKKADPSIKVGGGEFKNGWNNDLLDTFIKDTKEHLDFFTYHHNITGDINTLVADIFNEASSIAGLGSSIKSKLDNYGLENIPLWISEYNVILSPEYDPQNEFHSSSKGAVFNALVLKYLAERGKVDGCTLLNDGDFNYGVMDETFELRPTAHLMRLKNMYLVGTPVKTSSQNLNLISLFAVQATGHRSILLINLSDMPQTVNLNFWGWQPEEITYDLYSITGQIYDSTRIYTDNNFGQNMNIDAYSLLLMNFKTQTGITVEKKEEELPDFFELSPPFPNPFNQTTIIQFSVNESQPVKVLLYNARGQLIREIFQGWAEGKLKYTASIDGSDLASGQYQLYLLGVDYSTSRSLTLIK